MRNFRAPQRRVRRAPPATHTTRGGPALALARAFALHALTVSQRAASHAHPARLTDSVRCHVPVPIPNSTCPQAPWVERMRSTSVQGCTHWACAQQDCVAQWATAARRPGNNPRKFYIPGLTSALAVCMKITSSARRHPSPTCYDSHPPENPLLLPSQRIYEFARFKSEDRNPNGVNVSLKSAAVSSAIVTPSRDQSSITSFLWLRW
jgi:hypothetical protein